MAPLPAEARAALAAVTRELRDVPRAIIGDPAETVHFLARCARRLDGIVAMRVSVALPPPSKPPSAVLMGAGGPAVALRLAEQTFQPQKVTPAADTFSTSARKSPATSCTSATRSAPPPALRAREVRNRAGRVVPVRLRRAPGQLDLPL